MLHLLPRDALQRRILLMAGLVAAGFPLAKAMLGRELFDPRPYYVYFPGEGPFAVTVPPGDSGAGQLGEARTVFRAGEWLGFTSDLTVEAGVGLVGTRIIVRMPEGIEVRRTEVRLPTGARRQGKKALFERLPGDLRCGHYELRLRATFYPPDHPPVTADDFQRYPFEVPCP